MEEKKNILSVAGLNKLKDELALLKERLNVEIPLKIKEAREQGDLSENAEYDAAKDEQREIQTRIDEIENLIKHAEIIDEDDIDAKKVSVGCTVKLHDLTHDMDLEYQIVGNIEADSLNGKISHESPLGAALIGSKKGSTVLVEAPAGQFKYKVMKIAKTV